MKQVKHKANNFNQYEIKIINTLYNSGRILTTNEVTKYSNISRITTRKYLNKLLNDGYLRNRITLNKNKQIYKIEWRIK